MQIAKLPSLDRRKFTSLIKTFRDVIDAIREHKVESHYFELVLNASGKNPYVQMQSINQSGIRIEVSSNRFLRKKLTRWQESGLLVLGFAAPTKDIPNYSKTVRARESSEVVAIGLVEVFRNSFELETDSLISFGPDEFAIRTAMGNGMNQVEGSPQLFTVS